MEVWRSERAAAAMVLPCKYHNICIYIYISLFVCIIYGTYSYIYIYITHTLHFYDYIWIYMAATVLEQLQYKLTFQQNMFHYWWYHTLGQGTQKRPSGCHCVLHPPCWLRWKHGAHGVILPQKN